MTAENIETLIDEECEPAFKEQTVDPCMWTELADEIIRINRFCLVLFHASFILALSTYVFGIHTVPIKGWTIIWAFIVGCVTLIGETAGAHRLWTHRFNNANRSLKILLLILYTATGFNPLHSWIRDHRVHIKNSESDADPHNAKQGFIFSEIGSADCLRGGREMDMSNVTADPVIIVRKKYTAELRLLLCFVIPTMVPIIFWGESILHAVLTECFIRYILLVNFALSVNNQRTFGAVVRTTGMILLNNRITTCIHIKNETFSNLDPPSNLTD